jgi:hypothetical protein
MLHVRNMSALRQRHAVQAVTPTILMNFEREIGGPAGTNESDLHRSSFSALVALSATVSFFNQYS